MNLTAPAPLHDIPAKMQKRPLIGSALRIDTLKVC